MLAASRPTHATHRFAAAQETPESIEPLVPPPGSGTVASRQLLPFQIPLKLAVAVANIADPTVTQMPADGHDTLFCTAPMSPGRAGPFLIDQVLPFHHSITATGGGRVALTAAQRTGDAHETATRPLIAKPPPEAGGLVWVHPFPFQLSASGMPSLLAPQ